MKINVELRENASRTRYTIEIELKLGNEFWKRKVFSCFLKDGSELAEVTTSGRLFHAQCCAMRFIAVECGITLFNALLKVLRIRLQLPYLSALEMCSRQGAIQIHVYLTFTLWTITIIANRSCSYT